MYEDELEFDNRMMDAGFSGNMDAREDSLRPLRLSEYIGQDKVKENLKVYIDAAKLRGEGFIMRKHQRRAVGTGDDIGHGEGLARTRDAEQDLIAYARIEVRDQFVDSGGLIPGGSKGGLELEYGFGHEAFP